MSIPSEVVRCVRHGIAPREQEGVDWCASADCEQCEEAVWSELLRERDRLKAERDRALAELDKALGEREDAMLSERNAAYNKGYDEGFASADDWYAEHAEELAEHGWARLPRDADGEPIHMGDLVTVPWKDKVYEVAGFSCTKQLCSGIRTIWIDVYSPEKQRNVPLCGADSCRHYHAFTVEDVLDEMLQRFSEDGYEGGMSDLIAEYASKLREMLAGDVE